MAQRVANKLGLDSYKAELLPEEKVKVIEEYLINSNKRGKVALLAVLNTSRVLY